MYQEPRVPKEIAINLKELGFDWRINSFYFKRKDYVQKINLECDHNSLIPIRYSAPTLNQAIDWLRDVKNVSVEITSRYGYPNIFWEIHISDFNEIDHCEDLDISFTDYNKAQLKGIEEAINYLKNKVK